MMRSSHLVLFFALVSYLLIPVLLFGFWLVPTSLPAHASSHGPHHLVNAPFWLIGPPTCLQNTSHCNFNRLVWSALDKLRMTSLSRKCSFKSVIGCDLEWPTGLGHHMHHIGHCLSISLRKQKPVLLLDEGWRYGKGCMDEDEDVPKQPGMRFGCFFESFDSLACRELEFVSKYGLIRTKSGKGHTPYTSYEPSKVSASWVGPQFEAACSHHPNPSLAFKAALLRYAFRLNGQFSKLLQDAAKSMRMASRRPYAALHVRRGDKIGVEAEFHSLREYLLVLEELIRRSNTMVKSHERLLVFVASDDVSVVAEGEKKFADKYEFVRLANASELSDNYHSMDFSKRKLSTQLTLMDIAFLANSDFFVGTFSSQISRLAFELMTSKRGYVGHVYRKKAEKVVEPHLLAFNTSMTQFRFAGWHKNPPVGIRVASLDSFYYYGY